MPHANLDGLHAVGFQIPGYSHKSVASADLGPIGGQGGVKFCAEGLQTAENALLLFAAIMSVQAKSDILAKEGVWPHASYGAGPLEQAASPSSANDPA